MTALVAASPEAVDTTLLILPHALGDFLDYNDVSIFRRDRMLKQLRLEGVIQIASFHPHYQFEGSEPDDIENYTNRAPYPILHLLREDSIERAVQAFPDAEAIFTSAIRRRFGEIGLHGWNESHEAM